MRMMDKYIAIRGKSKS